MGFPDPQGPTDEELFRRIAAGDPEALAELYDRYAPRVLGLLVRLVGKPSDAEDLLQETFLQIWARATEYDPGRSTALAWLFLIARSRALDHLRRLRADSVATIEATPIHHESFADLERDESARQLRAILDQLPEPQRVALILVYFEGLTHTQVAEVQGVPLGTAKTRIRMGIQKLRDLLEGSREESSP